jgi:hypothetical protein
VSRDLLRDGSPIHQNTGNQDRPRSTPNV